MPDRTVRRLNHVLRLEHAAITQGAFDALPALSEEKETLLAVLPTGQATAADVSNISRSIARNQSLLSAAMEGVGAAQKTLEALRQVAKGSVVYDRSGAVSRLSTGAKGLSQKL